MAALPTRTSPCPTLQIPEAVRSKDPNFVYQPHYLLKWADSPFQLKLGPRAIAFSNEGNYEGRLRFFPFIEHILSGVDSTHLLDRREAK